VRVAQTLRQSQAVLTRNSSNFQPAACQSTALEVLHDGSLSTYLFKPFSVCSPETGLATRISRDDEMQKVARIRGTPKRE
jgi:hypothetical protein